MEDFILLLQYLLLGAFQGFTEPIPISSSGHLILLQHILGIEFSGFSFELIVNFASLLAVLVIYREDILKFANGSIRYVTKRDPRDRTDFQFVVYLVIATIPAGVIGLLFNDVISEYFKGVKVIAVTLIITGVSLWLIRNLKGRKNDGQISTRDAIIIGFAQAIALIPGISRSGATIVAAMGLGLKQETALKFSFLMFIPVSAGGVLLAVSDFFSDPNFKQLLIPYTIAFIAAFITSYYALKWFMNIMAKGNLKYFSYYCFIVGVAILLFF